MRSRSPVWNKPEVPVAEIPGFEHYFASKDGRIWSEPRYIADGRFIRGRWLRLGLNRTRGSRKRGGSAMVCVVLRRAGERRCVHVGVARSVLSAWIGPPTSDTDIAHHINYDPTDCRLANLRWMSPVERSQLVLRAGKCPLAGSHPSRPRGETSSSAKLTVPEVRQIRDLCKAYAVSRRNIAMAYGVSEFTVRCIASRKTWAHVPEVAK
jgi:hypothetical protein